jgi:hypothetical protein
VGEESVIAIEIEGTYLSVDIKVNERKQLLPTLATVCWEM